jgi:hypothetical protein
MLSLPYASVSLAPAAFRAFFKKGLALSGERLINFRKRTSIPSRKI